MSKENLKESKTEVAKIEQDADKVELLDSGQDDEMDLSFTKYVFCFKV